jgi:hypothetical protein
VKNPTMSTRLIALALLLRAELACDTPGQTDGRKSNDTSDMDFAADMAADAAAETPPDSQGPEPSSIPPECLPGDIPCVDQGDCVAAAGTRCNTAMEEPVCQTIRCGAEGAPCVDEAQCPNGMRCHANRCGTCPLVPEGGGCVNGQVVCLGGLTLCDSRCVDLRSDPEHCGACDTPVPARGYCASGASDCSSADQLCGGECVARDDREHCGGCGLSCGLAVTAACAGLECEWGGECESSMCWATVNLDQDTLCGRLCARMGGTCVEGYTYVAGAGGYPVGCDEPADHECVCAVPPRRAP